MSTTSVEREVFAREERRELKERVIEINRVAKVVKGGRRFSFTALVVIGDEVDRVGVGYGKAREVPLAITKAVDDAKKNLFTIPKHGTTITHQSLGVFGAARVLLRPASDGTGVIAGGGVRAVLELGGIRNVLAKSLGTTNPINMAKATVDALQKLRRPEDVARIRGKRVSEVLPVGRARPVEAEGAAPDAVAVDDAAAAPVAPAGPPPEAVSGPAPAQPPAEAADTEPAAGAASAPASEDSGPAALVEKVADVAQEAVDAAQSAVESVREKGVAEVAQDAVGAAREAAEAVREKGVVETVKEGVDKAKDVVARDDTAAEEKPS